MKDRLVEFLIAMDKDESLKQRYLADPKGTAESFGLSANDVEICVNNDIDKMKTRCEAEGADNINVTHMK